MGSVVFDSVGFPVSRKLSLRVLRPLRAPSSLCPKISFRIGFRYSIRGKGPAPGVPGVRESAIRDHPKGANPSVFSESSANWDGLL